MKRIGIAVVLFSSFCYGESSGGFEPASTNVWGAAYPRVDASGKAEFRIKAPEAAKVQLNFWGNAKIDMVKQPDGFWTATTAPLVPGFHYYTVLIDGAEFSDPGSHSFFGGGKDASAIEIPEPGSTYYLPQNVPHGDVREIWYVSKVTGTWRHALVYLPPGYDTQTKTRDDAGGALAAGRNSNVGTATTHGHTHAGQRNVEMHTWQQFDAVLKTEAHLFFM